MPLEPSRPFVPAKPPRIALHFAAACAVFVVAGCPLSHRRHEPDAAPLADGGAPPADGGTPTAPRDAGPDARETDAGPPTTGCFSEEVTIATAVEPAGRAHLRPVAIAAWERGWVAIYDNASRAERYVAFLDLDGGVRGTSRLERSYMAIQGVFVEGSSMIVVGGVAAQRIELGAAEISREYDYHRLATSVMLAASRGPSGSVRLLARQTGGRLRVTELDLDDDSTDGLAERSGDLRNTPELHPDPAFTVDYLRYGFLALQGDSLVYVGEVAAPSSWPASWHAMRAELDVSTLGAGEIGWRIVEDAVWEDPPSSARAITSDGRALTVRNEPVSTWETRQGSYLEPMPFATAPERPRTRLGDGTGLGMLERAGSYVGVLWPDRLGVFGHENLEPLGGLSFPLGEPPSMGRSSDLVAVLFTRGAASMEAELALRCMVLPH